MTKYEEGVLRQHGAELATLNTRMGAVEETLKDNTGQLRAIREELAERRGSEGLRAALLRPVWDQAVRSLVTSLVTASLVIAALWAFAKQLPILHP